jgi:uncharacterized membrane protein YeaQ/YmgE (transglycosylase-associated protein family)
MNTAVEFQKRRRRVGLLALPWLTVGVVGSITTSYFADGIASSEVMFVAFFACAMVGAIIGIKIYRCPNCGNVPNNDGVLFNPTICPSCGVPLK